MPGKATPARFANLLARMLAICAAIALGCLLAISVAQSQAHAEEDTELTAGSPDMSATVDETAQAGIVELVVQTTSDLQFVGLEGDSVTGSGTNPSGYTVYVRDGDTVEVTVKLKNVSGSDLGFVRMVDGPAYADDSGASAVSFNSSEEEFDPIEFAPLYRYDGDDPEATDATFYKDQYLKTEDTGVIMWGYEVAAGAEPTFKMRINAGHLTPGTYNMYFQLGRWRFEYDKTTEYYNGIPYETWPYARDEIEERYSAKIPLKVVVYNQDGASLRAGQGVAWDPVQTELTSAGIDFGTVNLATADDDELVGQYDVNVYNSGTPDVFVDDHGNTRSIKVVFGGENTGDAIQSWDGAAFAFSNGTLYDTNWDPLPPTATSGGSTTYQTAEYTVSYNATDLIAGTYTGNFIINTTPHNVSINGVAGNNAGAYKYPVKVKLTGINPRLLPRATALTATPGNGRVDLTWTPPADADEYTEYTIWRREGKETQTDPDKLDWSLYEEVGTKVAGYGGEQVLWVDGDVTNGTQYSYTVIAGRPYHGYAAATASAKPLSTHTSKMLAPDLDASDALGCVSLSWRMNDLYGGTGNDGAGMVDHFNIYRDGVLVDVIYQSAVADSYYDGAHHYSWDADEPVPELYIPYRWTVSAVSPSGVESDLSEGVSAQALGQPSSILSHNAWFEEDFYDEDTYEDVPAILIYAEEYGYGDTLETLNVWRVEGTTAPSTSGAPYAVAEKCGSYSSYMYDFADKNVTKNKTYTYTIQGVDGDGHVTNFHTFTVKAVEGPNFGTVKSSWEHPAWSVADNGKKARLQWYCDYDYEADKYIGTYKVYRDGTCIKTLSPNNATDGVFDFTDDPGADGAYVYRVDKVVNADGTNITVRGRELTFHRNTQPVDPATLLQPPDAPTLTGRTSGDRNIILSWTPAATGGMPEGYHIYRSDAGEPQLGARYVTEWRWYGQDDFRRMWGNDRYISLAGGDTLTFVDGETSSSNRDYYMGDKYKGEIRGLWWDEYNAPHEYYITAYNRAGESAPSRVVVFNAVEGDDGYPTAPTNQADEAPMAPILDKLWIEWEDDSSYKYGFDRNVYGYARVAWSDSVFSSEIDSWTVRFTGTHYDDWGNPPQSDTLGAALAILDPKNKLGAGENAPKTLISGFADGDLGRTITATVTAENSAGTATSNEMSVMVRGIPRFYAIPDSHGALLRWTDLTQGDDAQVTSWQIWRKAEYGLWEEAATLPASIDYAGEERVYGDSSWKVNYYEWADSGLDNGWTYEYKVVAVCTDGIDRSSVVREVTPTAASAVEAPGAPQNLRVAKRNGVIYLNWDEPATGGAVEKYHPQVKGPDIDWYYGAISNVSGNSTSAVYMPWQPGTYRILVWANADVGGEDVPNSKLPYEIDGYDDMTEAEQLAAMFTNPSNIVEVTITQADIDSRSTDGAGDFSLTLTPGDGQITLSWTASDNAVYYEVERLVNNYPTMPEATVAAVPGQNSYTFVDDTAEPGVKYQYRVSAYSAGNSGPAREGYATAGGKTRDQVAAERVSALIDPLPSPANVTLDDTEQVMAVQEVWESLTASQQALVDEAHARKLADDVEALELIPLREKYGDSDSVKNAQAKINALPAPSSITAANASTAASKVEAARAAYDAITPAEAKRIVDTTRLTADEARLAQIAQAATDQAAANAVIAKINDIGTVTSLDQKPAVVEARAAYDALTQSQKGLVSAETLAKLEAAEAKIASLEQGDADQAAANAVIAKINAIGTVTSLNQKPAVMAARAAYDALTEPQKLRVGEARSTLEAAETMIVLLEKAAADKAAADAVAALIEALPDPSSVTPADADAVGKALRAFNGLTNTQQGLVDVALVVKLEALVEALGPEVPVEPVQWKRLSGEGRYQTGTAIVDEGFTGTSYYAVVATGEGFPDALAASALAGAYDAPVILTNGKAGSLGDEARNELVRLGVKKVFIMGGTSAVSTGIEREIAGLNGGVAIDRVAGAGRIETSVEACKRVRAAVESGAPTALDFDTVILAVSDNFPDTLSIGPWSYVANAPILLVGRQEDMTDGVAAMVAQADRVIIVGGTATVGTSVEKRVKGIVGAGNVVRLAGADRYLTSQEIAMWESGQSNAAFQPSGQTLLSFEYPAVATGSNFPDALAGAALCGSKGSVMMLANAASDPTVDMLAANKAALKGGYLLGGPSAVSFELAWAIANKTDADLSDWYTDWAVG